MSKGEAPMIIRVQLFLEKRWKFRYNVVLGRMEFSFMSQEEYRLMSEYDFNSILKEL